MPEGNSLNATGANSGTPAQTWLRAGVGVAALVLLYLLARQAGGLVPRFALWVESLGVWGPIAFMIGYIVATVALVPGSVMTLAGGAIFGITWGVVYVFIAAVVASGLSFLIARYLAREAVERRLAAMPRFAAIDRAVGAQGLKIVFLLRLSPLFPFSILNYGMGLTNVSFRDYMLGAPGMLFGSLLYVYYGKLVGDVAALAGGAAPDKGVEYYVTLAIGLISTVVVTTVVTRIARQALAEATGE